MLMPVTLRPTLQSRFYVSYASTAPTAAQLNTFAGSVRSAWGTNLASLASTNESLTGVIATDLSSGGLSGSDSTTVAGTRAGTEAPVQSCVVIKFLIARRYRGGKPKIFLPFGVQADQADVAHWSGAFVTAVATGWGNFVTAVQAAGWTGSGALNVVNVSYYQGFTTVTRLPLRARNVPTLRGTPLVDTVTAFNVNSLMGSQRRRRSPG